MQHMVKRLVCLAYHMAAGHCAAVAMVCAVAGLGFGARAGVSSTGAEGLTVGGDTVLRFTSTAEGANSFTLDEATEAWILCVGGGGGGSTGGYADLRAAGGGAGGMLEELRVRLEPGTYSVKVGQGGAAQANGTPSTITLGETELYKALGGGASPSWGGAGNSGGSGGGGALKSAGGAGTAGQGNAGGSGSGSGGGGGGAGEPGHAGDAATDPGAGGAGRSSAITGSVVYYAGGGSGQRSTVSALGGGGRGGGAASSPGAAGTNGLGGGGGGGGGSGGGRGGNGVVIVRLLTSPYVSVPVPIASELSYTGTEQVGVPTGLGYSIINNTGTNAGSYMATASLEPGYCWPNGERTDTNIVWTIDKAVNTWLQAPALSKDRWAVNGRAAVLSEGVAMFGTTVATIAREGAAAEPFCGKLPMTVGRYALTYAVEESANASALSQTLSFEVVDAEWEVRKSGVMARGRFP